ncbi:unnamed protein product [Adineta steineri]|uniref:STIL N-terminal domain-containing protein n=1 Tax=Adineta steineri TaxID=433720 RepID=A0A819MCZ3_9BILA|nr:unnamed protein product [Adineta steineri]
MTYYMTSVGTSNTSLWDSTPIGRSIHLSVCQYDQLSPQLIIEDKVLRSAIRLQNHSIIYFVGTLISDDESQRLIYVIDRLLIADQINNHQLLTSEFLIPIQCNKNISSTLNTLIQTGMNEVDIYCRSSLPIELHRFSYLCGQMFLRHSSSINIDLSFDLVTIKNTFILKPISSNHIYILPTALLNNLDTSTGNNIYKNQPHFGYCSLDRMSTNKILLILENDPQACTLPLVGIWISGITDIHCSFVFATCIRYCIRSGIQSFLLACYLSTSYGQCTFYEVNLITNNSPSSVTIEYDLWTCSKTIVIPNCSTLFPYDFEFKRVQNESKTNHDSLGIHSENTSVSIQTPVNNRASTETYSNNYQTILSSPNTNGSIFGFPRVPPTPSAHQSPSWDLISTSPMTTPKRNKQTSPAASVKSKQFSSPKPSTDILDNQWKQELVERMQSYEAHIQSLTSIVSQLLTVQNQQSTFPTPTQECIKRDVAVQSQSSSPYGNNNSDESLLTIKNNQSNSVSPKTEHYQEQLLPPIQNQSPLLQSTAHQNKPMIDDSSSSTSYDLNPVDILKPIFQYIDNQQQKQDVSSLRTTNDEDIDHQTDNIFHSTNSIQQQQKHVTSTRTTGISFISNGLQMQFINQESSTKTVYPQPQFALLPNGNLPISPQKSENNLSIEVQNLEMKYLEDYQLSAAIEYDRQPQTTSPIPPETPRTTDKSLSFETQEYLQRYGLFTDSNNG